MVCPQCTTQMHQSGNKGGGFSGESAYKTYTIQECPKCGQKALEYYMTALLGKSFYCDEERALFEAQESFNAFI